MWALVARLGACSAGVSTLLRLDIVELETSVLEVARQGLNVTGGGPQARTHGFGSADVPRFAPTLGTSPRGQETPVNPVSGRVRSV